MKVQDQNVHRNAQTEPTASKNSDTNEGLPHNGETVERTTEHAEQHRFLLDLLQAKIKCKKL